MQSVSHTMVSPPSSRVEIKKTGQGNIHVIIGGQWCMKDIPHRRNPEISRAIREVEESRNLRCLTLIDDGLGSWDSSILVFLARLTALAHERGINVNLELPEGIRRLLSLAFAVPPIEEARCGKPDDFFLTALGGRILALGLGINEFLAFVGELAQACRRLISGSSHIRAQDFWEAVHECGVGSLPIISLTSLLFGLILAFVGSVQLTQFGAQIYVAGLVSIGMLRIMGAVMVGVVMAGRIGAAYAALMGAMQANEEVDALQAAGIRPVDFLILPRLLAMLIMTPLLTIYAGFLGIVGGFLVAVTIMDINPYEYFDTTIRMTPFRHVLVGLVYGTFFGIIIALAGCFHGMRCGRNARAVGLATTTAVVYSIVGVIVATAVITVIASILNV